MDRSNTLLLAVLETNLAMPIVGKVFSFLWTVAWSTIQIYFFAKS